MTAHVPNTNPNEDDSLLASAVVPPHQMERVGLGEYESVELIPALNVQHDVDGWDQVEWIENRKRLEDGTIRVFLLVQNFSDQAATVHVHRADEPPLIPTTSLT
ncbi:hypothetical protein [Streptomyces sp. NPDC002611]